MSRRPARVCEPRCGLASAWARSSRHARPSVPFPSGSFPWRLPQTSPGWVAPAGRGTWAGGGQDAERRGRAGSSLKPLSRLLAGLLEASASPARGPPVSPDLGPCRGAGHLGPTAPVRRAPSGHPAGPPGSRVDTGISPRPLGTAAPTRPFAGPSWPKAPPCWPLGTAWPRPPTSSPELLETGGSRCPRHLPFQMGPTKTACRGCHGDQRGLAHLRDPRPQASC